MSVAEANDPKTSPPRLIELSQSKQSEILIAVTQNPNTPLETLLTLAQKYPAQFLQNPAVPILLLENPALLHTAEEKTAMALLGVSTPPLWVLESLSSHHVPLVRQTIAENPNTSPSALENLAKDQNLNVRRAISKNLNTPPSSLGLLALDKDWDIHRNLSCHPNAPPSSLELLALSDDMHTRIDVANNPKTPHSALELLARDEKEFVRGNVAKNPSTPRALVEFIAKNSGEFHRQDKEREWRDADLEGPHWGNR